MFFIRVSAERRTAETWYVSEGKIIRLLLNLQKGIHFYHKTLNKILYNKKRKFIQQKKEELKNGFRGKDGAGREETG